MSPGVFLLALVTLYGLFGVIVWVMLYAHGRRERRYS